jgi:uncharacterized protein (TIGR03083 family)
LAVEHPSRITWHRQWGCHDQTVLTPSVYLDALTRDAATFIELVDSADHELPVPFCPGWNVGELARHLGGIHRWAHDVLVTGVPGDEPQGPTDRHELTSWLTEGATQLHEVLSTTDPQTPTWTFGPKPRLVEFWIRRQAQETFVHLWDAQTAIGISLRNDDELALDGIDEVVNMFFPRQVRLGRALPLAQPVAIHVSDFPGVEFVLAGDGSPAELAPAATITGTAAELLRLVWGRIDIGDLHVEGSADACGQLVAANLTP